MQDWDHDLNFPGQGNWLKFTKLKVAELGLDQHN